MAATTDRRSGLKIAAGEDELKTMSNKHVIAIFFTGVCLLLISFWAGLTISRHSKGTQSQATSAGPKAGQAGSSGGSNDQDKTGTAQSRLSPTPNDDQNARFIVHVATFGTAEQADRLTRELKRKYLSADTQQPTPGGDTLYRVNIGPYKSRADAEEVARELQGEGRKGIMVLPQNSDNHP
jgi:cell division protein FtsN